MRPKDLSLSLSRWSRWADMRTFRRIDVTSRFTEKLYARPVYWILFPDRGVKGFRVHWTWWLLVLSWPAHGQWDWVCICGHSVWTINDICFKANPVASFPGGVVKDWNYCGKVRISPNDLSLSRRKRCDSTRFDISFCFWTFTVYICKDG